MQVAEHERRARALIMGWPGARAHELGQACGIRWDVGSVKGSNGGRRVGGVESSDGLQRVPTAPSFPGTLPFWKARQAETAARAVTFRISTPADDAKSRRHTSEILAHTRCRPRAESLPPLRPYSACPAPPIPVPSLLLLPRTTHPSSQQPYCTCHATVAGVYSSDTGP
jgi:hypothetical protein